MKSNVSVRSVLGYAHLWCGLILFIPFVILGLTGCVLVFHHEIMDWQAGEVVHATQGAPRAPDAIVESARDKAPEGLLPVFLSMPDHPGRSASVRFAPEGGSFRSPRAVQVFVDPVTLEVLGTRTGGNPLIGFVHRLHANLMLDRATGRSLVGWLGVAMFVLGVTGIVLWWPRNGGWKAAFTVKWRASVLRLNRDLHGAIGIWMIVIFLVVTVTGIYLCFPQTSGTAVRAVFPGDNPRAVSRLRLSPAPGAEAMPHAMAINLAREAVPDARILNIAFPAAPDRPLRVRMAREGYMHGAPAITVLVDPYTGRVAAVSDPRDFTTGQWIQSWQRSLHGGEGLGWIWKMLVFLSGLLPLLFSVTGIAMWWIKRKRRGASADSGTPTIPAGE